MEKAWGHDKAYYTLHIRIIIQKVTYSCVVLMYSACSCAILRILPLSMSVPLRTVLLVLWPSGSCSVSISQHERFPCGRFRSLPFLAARRFSNNLLVFCQSLDIGICTDQNPSQPSWFVIYNLIGDSGAEIWTTPPLNKYYYIDDNSSLHHEC